MSLKKNPAQLSASERVALSKVSRSNRASVREKTRARVLLLSDENCSREDGGSLTDGEIARRLGCAPLTVSKVRAGERGVLESIRREEQKKRKARKLNGRGEAQLLALTCSAPPQGRSRWSLVLLRERLIEMEIVEHIGLETIRSPLKKRAQAVAQKDGVYPTARRCVLCSCDGGCAGSLRAALPEASGGVPG
jgi:hypothetical protein